MSIPQLKRLASLVVLAIALIVLGLLMFHENVAAIPVALMKGNVALCLVLISVAALQSGNRTARIFASVGFCISILTLSQYLFGFESGIDELLVKDRRMIPGQIYPGRM